MTIMFQHVVCCLGNRQDLQFVERRQCGVVGKVNVHAVDQFYPASFLGRLLLLLRRGGGGRDGGHDTGVS